MASITVKIAIFGVGRMGKEHVKNLLFDKNVIIAYIIDRSPEILSSIKAEFPLLESDRNQCKFLTNDKEDAVFSDESVDGIVIATTTADHEHLVLKGLESGKRAIFCEKPLAPDLDGIKNCLGVAQDCQIPIFCGFNRRFDPSFAAVHTKVRNGDVGKIHVIKITSRDDAVPPISYLKNSGGFLRDSTVHDIDMACWLLKEYPREVYCAGHANYKSVAEIGDIDTLIATLKFPSGALVVIDQSRSATYGMDNRIEVFGEKGMLQGGNTLENNAITANGNGFTAAPFIKSPITRYTAAYRKEMEHFVDILLNDAVPMTSPRSILQNMIIVNALVESKDKKLPVEIQTVPASP